MLRSILHGCGLLAISILLVACGGGGSSSSGAASTPEESSIADSDLVLPSQLEVVTYEGDE